MDEYKNRIHKALDHIGQSVVSWQKEKSDLENQIKSLQTENYELKKITNAVASELDKYILEIEEIRRNYGSSNGNNK